MRSRSVMCTLVALSLAASLGVVGRAGAAQDEVGRAEREIAETLDTLHATASQGDGRRYFSLFTEDAIFFGTDPQERWTIEEFHGYADPVFESGRGWTYHVDSRHIFVGPSGDMAWFDEQLSNERYGRCRGTGVLVLEQGEWRIAQYNLSIPIPNDLALTVVAMIQASR